MRVSAVTMLAFAAASVAAFEYPDFVPLHRRQAPGTPQYDCHASCGGVISSSRTENYCQAPGFPETLTACLECALEFNIWQYYSNSVEAAATGCGLDATPVPAPANSTTTEQESSGTNATSTSGTESATSSASEAATTSSESETSAAAETSSSTASGSAPPAQQTGNSASSSRILAAGLAIVPIGALVAALI